MEMKIPLFKPCLGKEELEALRSTFNSGWIGLGPKTVEFENAMAQYHSRRFGVGTNSCTAALHLAIDVLNLPTDAEILIPTISFVAAPNAAEFVGKKVVFVDVREDDLCINIDDLEKKITPKSRVVIPVHMGGQACQMDHIKTIADKNKLIVIEDVANAQGGEWKGKKLGSLGHLGVFSFEAKKNMTTGDGGMIVFDNEEWLEPLKQMRWLGINRDTWRRFSGQNTSGSWYYEVNRLGLKYNMNDVTASIGLCQLKKLDHMNKSKRDLIKRYKEELAHVGDLFIPTYDLNGGGYWLFIVHTDRRDALIEYLGSNGIICGVHFMPSHLHPYYRRRYPEVLLPISEKVWKRFLSLPLYPTMSENEQDYVIETVKIFFKEKA